MKQLLHLYKQNIPYISQIIHVNFLGGSKLLDPPTPFFAFVYNFSIRVFRQEYINGEYATPIWGSIRHWQKMTSEVGVG